MPEQGDILLVPVPFTDLSSQKRRPVIVISTNSYHRSSPDIVVVAMTSGSFSTPYCFTIDLPDLVEGKLNRAGTVRVEKIYTLARSIVVKKFGKVSPTVVARIRVLLESLTTPSN